MGELALGTGSKKKKMRLLGALTGAGLVLAVIGGYLLVQLLFGGGAAAGPQAAPEQAPPLVSEAGLEQRNGVRITPRLGQRRRRARRSSLPGGGP